MDHGSLASHPWIAELSVAAADTGAWSLYSYAGREATLSYHQLIEEFLSDMCEHTERRTYCDAARRFARYEREPTRIGIAPLAAVLSFLRQEGESYRLIAARAGDDTVPTAAASRTPRPPSSQNGPRGRSW